MHGGSSKNSFYKDINWYQSLYKLKILEMASGSTEPPELDGIAIGKFA